jgi:hypothetical protein
MLHPTSAKAYMGPYITSHATVLNSFSTGTILPLLTPFSAIKPEMLTASLNKSQIHKINSIYD